MSAIIRPVTAADFREKSYGVVLYPSTGDSSLNEKNTVESEEIFGSRKDSMIDDVARTASRFYRKGCIELAIPVPNFFVLGEKVNMLQKITKMYACYPLAEGAAAYSTVTKTVMEASNPIMGKKYRDSGILLGGDAIRAMLEDFDPDKEIISILHGVYKFIKSTVVGDLPKGITPDDMGTISHEPRGLWLIDDYYFNNNVEIDETLFNEKMERLRAEALASVESRLAFLLALRREPDILSQLMMDKLFVQPTGYRPTIDKRRDPMTKAYNEVLNVNNKLRNMLNVSNARISVIRELYRDLVIAVKAVFVVKPNDTKYKQLIPLAVGLKGKYGHIRGNMQSCRSDYTGRTVITVDPVMSIDTIGIPASMAAKLCELHLVRNLGDMVPGRKYKFITQTNTGTRKRMELLEHIFKDYPGLIGRQPTLYQLGIQGYKVVIVPGNAIVLNPLITPAFNADFDGDQMHFSVPLSAEACREAKLLMSALNNLFYPRSGECIIAPRHELIYGLWKATTIEVDESLEVIKISKGQKEFTRIMDMVISSEIGIEQPIECEGQVVTAGRIALWACLTPKYSKYRLGVIPLTDKTSVPECPVSENWFKQIIKMIAIVDKSPDKSVFVTIINKLVAYAFAVADDYPPNITLMNRPDVSAELDAFEAKVAEREDLYDRGFETEEDFTEFFNTAYSELDKDVQASLKRQLGKDNGYMDMVASKAHISMSNVVQLFGMKGRVKKNDQESFNAVIRHSSVTQLTELEHFITAYGSRSGIIEKNISTYGPGYFAHMLEHNACIINVTVDDCGTKDGIEIDFDFVKQFIPYDMQTQELSVVDRQVREYVSKILPGRYIVGPDKPLYVKDEASADEIYNTYISPVKSKMKKKGIKLRSPITCKCPCCAKCYGMDIGQQAPVVPGTAIGYIASQSIGEPATQLSMKNFQNGGIAGVKNLTTSFQRIEKYFELISKYVSGMPLQYDMLSPVEGVVELKGQGDGTSRLTVIVTDPKTNRKYVQLASSKIRVYDGIKLKPYVKKGESFQVQQGDLDIKEIMKYRGVSEAQRYLAFMVYDIFAAEVFVNIKHFETIISSMTNYICYKGNDYFKAGCSYTIVEYNENDTTGCIFGETLNGIKRNPLYRNDVFSAIAMENISLGLCRSLILSGYDSMTNPLVRVMFGLHSNIGSDVPGYLDRRGRC